jgi:hypothetical protein
MEAKGTFLFRATKVETLVTVLKREETQIAGIFLTDVWAADQISIGQAGLTFVTSFVIF